MSEDKIVISYRPGVSFYCYRVLPILGRLGIPIKRLKKLTACVMIRGTIITLPRAAQ